MMANPYEAIRDGFYCRAHKEMYDDNGRCGKCIAGEPEWKEEQAESYSTPSSAFNLPLGTIVWRVLMVTGVAMILYSVMKTATGGG